MIKIILAALGVIDAVIVYACCVVAGRADNASKAFWEDKYEQK